MDSRWVVYGFLGGFNITEGVNMQLLFKKRASLLTTTLRGRSI
jgi:tumor protein p53-inducible protein 3